MSNLIIIVAIIVILFLFWRFLFFFRNPNRKIPFDDRSILSPADGYIVYVKKVIPGQNIFSIKKGSDILLDDLMFIDEELLLNKQGWLIGIAMGPLDVHYNRAPISGKIRKIRHDFPTGNSKNLDMFPVFQNLFFNLHPYWKDCDYIVSNERASYIINHERLTLYVTQIADNWIKKIVTYKDNETIRQGEIFGLIRMGSQVDLFIPESNNKIMMLVKERARVKAGVSVIAKLISE